MPRVSGGERGTWTKQRTCETFNYFLIIGIEIQSDLHRYYIYPNKPLAMLLMSPFRDVQIDLLLLPPNNEMHTVFKAV